MNCKTLISVLLIALPCLSFMARAQVYEIKTPTYQAPPKYFLDGGTEVKGLCIDVVRAIELIEPSVKFVKLNEQISQTRSEQETMAGTYDLMLCNSISPKRQANLVIVDTPVFSIDDVLVVRADDPVAVKSLDDIRKMTDDNLILSVKGTAQLEWISQQPGLTVDKEPATSNEANFSRLIAKRGRFIFMNEANAINLIKMQKLENQLRILPHRIRTIGRYFLFSKKTPPEVVAKVAAALKKLERNGTLKKIAASYVID